MGRSFCFNKLYMTRQQLKNLMLPIARVGGAALYPWMHYAQPLSPYLIFVMLFITYCKLDFRHLRVTRFQWHLLAVQLLMSALAYVVFLWNHTVAEGVFICVFIPTATAAPVITAMLGGSIASVATYSLLGNLVTAILGPLVLAAIGDAQYTFIQSFLMILAKVAPLLVGPIMLALIVRTVFPKFHKTIQTHQSLSFYIWAVALFIIVGCCVSFTIRNYVPGSELTMVLLALGALLVCVAQFKVGRRIGGIYGDKVAGGQGLAQKNTVLAVWLAMAYMTPIASIAPAAYIAWQNIINSWQIMRHKERP